MTVSSAVRTAGPFTGTGAVSVYAFAFKVFLTTDVLVQLTSTAGVLSTGVLGTDYSVSLNANQDTTPGGNVILTTALPVGALLTIGSQVPLTQGVVLTNPGGWYPQVISDALDKITILAQQLLAGSGNGNSIRVPEIVGIPQLPAAAARANSYLLFDALGNPTTAALGSIGGQLATYVAPGSTVVLNVPSQYASISAALTALTGWVIHGTAQIKVADGTYVPTATISLNHPFGQNIQLIGNTATPGNCIIKPASPSFDLLSVSGGRFGMIAGFRLDLAAKAGSANNVTAVLALNGARIAEVKNLEINNWYYQLAAREGGSQMYAHDCTCSNAGDVAVWAFSGGSITGFNLTVSGANDSANNFGYGFQAEYGGVIDVTTSSATTCYKAGFAALSNGTGRYYTCTSNANTGSGFLAQAGGVIEANGSSTTNNTRYGMEFFGAGTCTGMSANTGNTLGIDNGAMYIDQGNLGARIASNGDMRIDVNATNNWFFNSSGGVQFSVSHSAASVSWISVTGSASSPFMKSAGPAANIDLNIQAKGTGTVFLGNNGANYLRVNPQASGLAPQLRAEGGDVDIDILIGGKGAGLVRFGSLTASGDAVMSGYITIKDAAGTTRKLMVTT